MVGGATQSTETEGRASARIDPLGQLGSGSALDLHEGIVPPDPRTGGCERWPEGLWLLNRLTGEVVPGRCKSTNQCPYCRILYTVETVEMWTLDALEWAPTLYAVLTAREHLTRADCRKHLDHLLRALRARWAGCEWATSVEFQRRGALHLNLSVKGVPVEDVDDFRSLLFTRWCARVDALPKAQWCEPISDAQGVVKYIADKLSHGLKREQAPPLGWSGHRTSQTRGYLVRPASVMRLEAQASLRLKRKLWRGLSLEEAERELSADQLIDWTLSGKYHGDGRAAIRADARRPLALSAAARSRAESLTLEARCQPK